MEASDLNWSEDDWARLGRALMASRQEQGLTQVETADKAGISRATLQQLERGRPSRLKTALALSRALSWPPWHAEDVLIGKATGRPAILQREDAVRGAEPTDDLPLAVSHELRQGALIDSDVVELGDGSGARIIVVMRGETDMTSEQIEAALKDWRRMRRMTQEMRLGEASEG